MPERAIDWWVVERDIETNATYTRLRVDSHSEGRREIFKYGDEQSGRYEKWVQAAPRSFVPGDHTENCDKRRWEVHWRDNTTGCCWKWSETYTRREADSHASYIQRDIHAFEAWIQPVKIQYSGQWRVWWRNFRKADRNKGDQVGDHESMSRLIPQLDVDWPNMLHWIEPDGLTDNLTEEKPTPISPEYVRSWFATRSPFVFNAIPLTE